MDPKWQFLHALWEHRTKFLVLVLIVSLIAPQPARARSPSTLDETIAKAHALDVEIITHHGQFVPQRNEPPGPFVERSSTVSRSGTRIMLPCSTSAPGGSFGGTPS